MNELKFDPLSIFLSYKNKKYDYLSYLDSLIDKQFIIEKNIYFISNYNVFNSIIELYINKIYTNISCWSSIYLIIEKISNNIIKVTLNGKSFYTYNNDIESIINNIFSSKPKIINYDSDNENLINKYFN